MPTKKTSKPDPSSNDYAVGDRIKANLHFGKIVDATIKAIVSHSKGVRLQVDFGKDETALIHLWQVGEKLK
jgi:hypothetical protein